MSNKSISFYTGLCLINSKTNVVQQDVIIYRVDFRKLSESEIEIGINLRFDFTGLGVIFFE